MFNKTKHKNKKLFCRNCLQCFTSERVLEEHRKICLEINGKQSVKLESGSIKFKNYFKEIAVPFKIYADTEFNLEKNHINNRDKNTSFTEKYQNHVPCSFAYKLVSINDKFSKPVVLDRRKNAIYKLIEAIREEYVYNINFIMSPEDESRFQSSRRSWICNKLFNEKNKKVRDHDHITGKYRRSAHSNCNINVKLNENFQ